MKKFVLIIASILLGTGLMAQGLNIGLRGGLTTAKISTDLSENFASDNKLGYQGGAFVRLNFGKLFVQPELIYNHRSTKLEYTYKPVAELNGIQPTVGLDYSMKIGTFDIPVLVGFKLVDNKLFNFRIFAGPVVSFSTNKELSYEYVTGDGENFDLNESDGPLTVDDFNSSTWYLQAGAGVDVLFLTFDVRYEKGLSDLYSGKTVNFKSNVWVFTLGFKII